jgi:putative transposase
MAKKKNCEVETHWIKRGHPFFAECESVCVKAKCIYNEALYEVRKKYETEGKYINSRAVRDLVIHSWRYNQLPRKVSYQVLKNLHDNYKAYFAALRAYKIDPSRFEACPQPPQFKEHVSILIFEKQALLTRKLKKFGTIGLSQTEITISPQRKDPIQQARIIPINQEAFKIEIVYNIGKLAKVKLLNPNNYIGIDLGIDNLCTIVGNKTKPIIISGLPLKSFNQYFNKRRAALCSQLKSKKTRSKRLDRLSNKRNCKIDDYLHKSSKVIIDHCLNNEVGLIIIGYNSGWKQNVNMGKRNNQKFVHIPFLRLVQKIEYKAKRSGITVVRQEEAYTSKCSFLDNEAIEKHESYLGKRIKRGLFRTSNGTLINADVNGAANIVRKGNSDFTVSNYGIEAVSARPLKINPLANLYKPFPRFSIEMDAG